MISLASWFVAGHLLTSPLHPVDFQLAPDFRAQPSAPTPVPPGPSSNEPAETYAPPRYSIAHGFGNGVPLSFATKQMVPPTFRVVFRNTVNTDLLVSWFGGRPWNQVLKSALSQHGLHMAVVGRTVTIGY